MATAMAAVGNPVADDPFVSLGVGAFFYLAGAFVVSALLFQFRFRAIWCLVVCEAIFLFWYFFGLYRVDPNMYLFRFLQVLLLPILLVPTYLGYYFNKHIIHS